MAGWDEAILAGRVPFLMARQNGHHFEGLSHHGSCRSFSAMRHSSYSNTRKRLAVIPRHPIRGAHCKEEKNQLTASQFDLGRRQVTNDLVFVHLVHHDFVWLRVPAHVELYRLIDGPVPLLQVLIVRQDVH
jgi:hypothetical protein